MRARRLAYRPLPRSRFGGVSRKYGPFCFLHPDIVEQCLARHLFGSLSAFFEGPFILQKLNGVYGIGWLSLKAKRFVYATQMACGAGKHVQVYLAVVLADEAGCHRRSWCGFTMGYGSRAVRPASALRKHF